MLPAFPVRSVLLLASALQMTKQPAFKNSAARDDLCLRARVQAVYSEPVWPSTLSLHLTEPGKHTLAVA